ncbi:MAG: TetR/AcrR family transcriptional regulator [Actinomycetota bacterium]
MTEPTAVPTPVGAQQRRAVGHRADAGQGELLRAQLLDAAEAQLAARGSIQAVSLRQVARDVGVSATSVYLHFADKDDLFIGVCQRRFEAFAQLLREAREGLDSAAAQVKATGKAYVRFGMEHPEQYAILFGGVVPVETVKARIPEEELAGYQALLELAAVVRQGIESGEFRQVDPFMATLTLWSTVHGLVGVLAHGFGMIGEVDVQSATDTVTDLLLEGLRAP